MVFLVVFLVQIEVSHGQCVCVLSFYDRSCSSQDLHSQVLHYVPCSTNTLFSSISNTIFLDTEKIVHSTDVPT